MYSYHFLFFRNNNKKVINRILRKSTTSDSRLLSSNHSNSSLDEAMNGGPTVGKPAKTITGSTIPSPPPIPKMEFLLSKLPKSKQIQINNLIRAESLLSHDVNDGNDSDTASVGSGRSHSSGGSSGRKKRKDGNSSSPAQKRRHNKPGSSPPLPRRARVRKLTPFVKIDGTRQHPVPSPKRLFFDEPLPVGQISPRHASPSPTVSPFSSGASSRNITPSSSFRDGLTQPKSDTDTPYDFMKALNTAITNTPNQPKFMRQNSVTKSDEDDDGTISPTLLEIEHQLQAMQQMVDGDKHIDNKQFKPSTKATEVYDDEDDDDDDSDSSITETSSEEEMDEFIQLNMIKPNLETGGTNIHMPKRKLSPISISGGMGGVINRGRLVQKRQVYRPRLYSRRRFSRLDTIFEETEERFHTGVRQSTYLPSTLLLIN